MALQKTKTIKGFTSNYWRFLEIHSNMNREDAVCVFGLYKDKETRDADSSAIVNTVQFNLNSEVLSANASSDTVKNINIAKAYQALKTRAVAESAKTEERNEDLAYFSDAQDV